MELRLMTIEDYSAVYALWLSCKGMGLNDRDDSRAGIARYLARNPTTRGGGDSENRAGCVFAERGRKRVLGENGLHLARRPDLPQQAVS